jgi:hypothetical protein
MFMVNEIEVESPREMDVWLHGYSKGLETMRNLLVELDMLNTKPSSHGPGFVPLASSAPHGEATEHEASSPERMAFVRYRTDFDR